MYNDFKEYIDVDVNDYNSIMPYSLLTYLTPDKLEIAIKDL